jgi:hypothetical protein
VTNALAYNVVVFITDIQSFIVQIQCV